MSKQQDFEKSLEILCKKLTAEALKKIFRDAKTFENRVRTLAQEIMGDSKASIDFDPHPQAFPDIAVGEFGIEVKFTSNDTWRSVANSILETNRIREVKKIYLVYGKMGGRPEVKWGEYDKCVMHVRTSHVPRFEVEMDADRNLFERMGVPYDEFRELPMEDKMRHIRSYARSNRKKGERMWWLEDSPDEPGHTLPIQARLYTELSDAEKVKLRAEAALISPKIVGSARDKYYDAVLYLLTYRGVLCHQARDLFTAGSVANPKNDDDGGGYMERALLLIEDQIVEAASRLEDALFVEYWGESIPPEERIVRWLQKADELAKGWVPSRSLFLKKSK